MAKKGKPTDNATRRVQQGWQRLSIKHLTGVALALGVVIYGINLYLLSSIDFDHAHWQREPRSTSIYHLDRVHTALRL